MSFQVDAHWWEVKWIMSYLQCVEGENLWQKKLGPFWTGHPPESSKPVICQHSVGCSCSVCIFVFLCVWVCLSLFDCVCLCVCWQTVTSKQLTLQFSTLINNGHYNILNLWTTDTRLHYSTLQKWQATRNANTFRGQGWKCGRCHRRCGFKKTP